jgi:hypothetical protein
LFDKAFVVMTAGGTVGVDGVVPPSISSKLSRAGAVASC